MVGMPDTTLNNLKHPHPPPPHLNHETPKIL